MVERRHPFYLDSPNVGLARSHRLARRLYVNTRWFAAAGNQVLTMVTGALKEGHLLQIQWLRPSMPSDSACWHARSRSRPASGHPHGWRSRHCCRSPRGRVDLHILPLDDPLRAAPGPRLHGRLFADYTPGDVAVVAIDNDAVVHLNRGRLLPLEQEVHILLDLRDRYAAFLLTLEGRPVPIAKSSTMLRSRAGSR